MAKRRANHEGTIFKRENGTWRAQVSIHGRRLSYTGQTQKECQEWVKKTRKQLEAGYSYDSAQTTLEDFLNNWVASIQSSRAPGTWQLYKYAIEREINPYLGKIKLKDLHPDHIQNLYDHRTTQGTSPHTIKKIHKVLHRALKQGVKLGLFLRNPASAVTPPKIKTKEMAFYTEEQVQQFLKSAQEWEEELYPLYYLAIHTGMRKSELLGLRWTDLDFKHHTLQVQRQLRWLPKGKYEFAAPKTRSGIRTIILGEKAIQVLQKHHHKHELIFCQEDGSPLKNHLLYQSFKRVIEQSGLPEIRFHDLRHTAASIMLNYGIPVIIVSKRLGHAKPSITMDVYGHIIPSRQEEAAKLMDRLMIGSIS